MSIDDQNQQRKGKLLSHSYISPQIIISKEDKNENENFFFEKNKNKNSQSQEKIEIEQFWKNEKNIFSKIVLFGRAGIGKVKSISSFVFIFICFCFIFYLFLFLFVKFFSQPFQKEFVNCFTTMKIFGEKSLTFCCTLI